jgi:hypothetical protein
MFLLHFVFTANVGHMHLGVIRIHCPEYIRRFHLCLINTFLALSPSPSACMYVHAFDVDHPYLSSLVGWGARTTDDGVEFLKEDGNKLPFHSN